MRTLQFDPYSKHARLEAEICGRVILRAPTARRADRDSRVTSDNPMGKNLPLLDARGREISEGIRNQCDQKNVPPPPPPHSTGVEFIIESAFHPCLFILFMHHVSGVRLCGLLDNVEFFMQFALYCTASQKLARSLPEPFLLVVPPRADGRLFRSLKRYHSAGQPRGPDRLYMRLKSTFIYTNRLHFTGGRCGLCLW